MNIFAILRNSDQSTDNHPTMTPNNALDIWLAEEAIILERIKAGAGIGVSRPEQLVGKTGLELMQAMLDGQLPSPEIGKTLDFLLVDVGPGRAVFQGTPGQPHLNPMGGIHGGWYATLLDSALGCAVQTMMPAGRSYTTAELGVNIVKAITTKVQRVRAIGTVLHCGRQLATAEARLVGPDGTLYAHATTTCLVFEMATRK
jgi:uncharacterized protein (TIGR00369 family)